MQGKVFARSVGEDLRFIHFAVAQLDDPNHRILRVLKIFEKVLASDEVSERRDRI